MGEGKWCCLGSAWVWSVLGQKVGGRYFLLIIFRFLERYCHWLVGRGIGERGWVKNLVLLVVIKTSCGTRS